MKNTFKIELTKLPKRIRTMKLSEFSKEYKGDILSAMGASADADDRPVVHTVRGEKKTRPTSVRMMRRARARTLTVKKAARSSPDALRRLALKTPAREPRAGEILCSLNGSPLVVAPSATTVDAVAQLKALQSQVSGLLKKLEENSKENAV